MATPSSILAWGKSRGQRSLKSYGPWGRKEQDTTEQLTHTHSITVVDPCCLFQAQYINIHVMVKNFIHSITKCSCITFEICFQFSSRGTINGTNRALGRECRKSSCLACIIEIVRTISKEVVLFYFPTKNIYMEPGIHQAEEDSAIRGEESIMQENSWFLN